LTFNLSTDQYRLSAETALSDPMDTEFDFQWSKAYAKRPNEPAYKFHNGKICQVGTGGTQDYAPLQIKTLFDEFTALDGTPTACVAFAGKYGLLTKPAGARSMPSEDLSVWQKGIKEVRALKTMLPALSAWGRSRNLNIEIGELKVLIVPSARPNALPQIAVQPNDLIQAMRLQLAQFAAGGGIWLKCQNEECGRLFAARRARGEAKRTIAKFCSTACRNRYHYLERAK
jgi:hypothetical protein